MTPNDSLASLMGDAEQARGVEAETALARLRRGMFDADAAPVQLGKYRNLEEIGRGGMSVVYRAHDPELDRDVAIKVLRADAGDAVQRLRTEAQAMARLSHPHVVQVLEVGQHRDETFVVMELVDGGDASQWLAARPRSWRSIVEMFVDAGRGLAAAHAQGLVHRDFKPSNVMVGSNGRVQVTDFGLVATDRSSTTLPGPPPKRESSDASGSSRMTATGTRLGTPRYMAPEQQLGHTVDARADQWSFAVSLWESVYGRHPFADATGTPGDANAQLQSPPANDAPRSLQHVLGRALQQRPSDRHRTMERMLLALESVLRPRRRWPVVTALGAAALGVGVWSLADAAPPTPACDPTEVMGTTWDAERRERLSTAFAATELPYAAHAWDTVTTRVDPWVHAWQRHYRQACDASAVDAPKAGGTMACLRTNLAEVDALLEVFASPGADLLTRVDRAFHELPDPAECSTARAETAGIDAQVLADHEQRLAGVRAQTRVGHYAQAAELAALAATAVTEYPLLHRRAQVWSGESLRRGGKNEAADAVFRPTFYEAAAAQDATISSRSALNLLTLALRRNDYTEAQDWERHAQTWIARIVDRPFARELERQRATSIAARLTDQGKYDEALAQLDLAWDLCDRDEASIHAPLLFNQIGLIQIERSAYDLAEQALVRSIRLQSERVGRRHPQVAHSINNLGNVHWYRADYDAAELAYQETYEIRLASLGPTHKETAVTMMNLGLIADIKGDKERAVELLGEAVEGLSAALGRRHPQTALAIGNLAATLGNMGEWEQANAHNREALEIAIATLGPEHPRVAHHMQNLASGLSDAGQHAQALPMHRKALELVAEIHGREHQWYATGLHGLAAALRNSGDHAQAERREREAVVVYEKVLGPEHSDLAAALVGLARDAAHGERHAQVVELATRALSLNSPVAAVRGWARFLLARAQHALGHRDEIVPLVELAQAELREAGKVGADPLAQLTQWRLHAGY